MVHLLAVRSSRRRQRCGHRPGSVGWQRYRLRVMTHAHRAHRHVVGQVVRERRIPAAKCSHSDMAALGRGHSHGPTLQPVPERMA